MKCAESMRKANTQHVGERVERILDSTGKQVGKQVESMGQSDIEGSREAVIQRGRKHAESP